MFTILIADDEERIRRLVSDFLRRDGYTVLQAADGGQAMELIDQKLGSIDLIILDVMMPVYDGWSVLRHIRSKNTEVPVMMLTARTEENDEVFGFDLGADDYITKPFGTSELLARIRTALRHQAKLESGDDMPRGSYSVRDLTVDFERRKVTLRGEEVHLTQIEYKIVELIARRPGRVLTYDYIISRIWGPYAVDNNRILRVNMAHIRRKLEDNPAEPYYIRTEIGVGYRMAEE